MHWPQRHWLQHDRPSWVDAHDPIFITFCGLPRGLNQFAKPTVWTRLVATAEHLYLHHRCEPLLLLAMPDHVHLLVRIHTRFGIRAYIQQFKHSSGYGLKLRWQSNAFDHRIRGQQGVMVQWHYILQNPVRAQLVAHPDDWPYRKTWSPNG